MSEINKNLGHATAYGYAKSKGYEGTEEEFAELMADYASVAESAAQSAADAAQSATDAETSETNAASSASDAAQSALSASASATSASTSATTATGAAGTATTAAQTATTKASEATQSATNAATSAATANSAADDATAAKTAAETANTAAQAAKTAAETAETNAETAAASVSASAAQIAENTEDITDLKTETNHELSPVFTLGKGINTSGAIATSSKRMATESFIDVTDADSIEYSVVDGYRIALAFYSAASESSFVSVRYWLTGSGRLRKEGNFIRLTYAKVDETTAITLSEASNFKVTVNYPLLRNVETLESDIPALVSMLNDNVYNVPLKWYQGTPTSWNAARIFSNRIDVTNAKTVTIKIAEGMQYYITYYDESDTVIVGRGWYTVDKTFAPEYGYMRLSLAYTDSSNITSSDYTSNMLTISYITNSLLQYLSSEFIPTYWETEIETSISAVLDDETVTDAQGESFVFVTDTHWSENAKRSPALIKKIRDNTNAKKIVFGGDVLTLYSTQAEALQVGRSFYKAFADGDMKPYSLFGNHDMNNNNSTYGSTAYLNYPIVYSYMFKSIEGDVKELPKYGDTNGDGNRNLYYYVDNEIQKIRYIFLNNGRARIGTVQTNWLKSKITELSSGWTVVVFAHRYWIGTSNGAPALDSVYGTDITDAIDAVYSSASATVACLIVGHCHYDYSITTDNGYPVIATTTDCYALSNTTLGETMTLGTDTEQAFDVFSIDTKNRKIYAVRVGAGSDREWSY